MSKSSILILGLLVVGFIVGGIFFWQRGKNPTSGNFNTSINVNRANTNRVTPLTPIFIRSLDPAKGPADKQTEVMVKGGGFEDGVKVYFGKAEGAVVFKSEKELNVKTPKLSKGVVDLRAVNPNGKNASFPKAFTFE